MSQIFISHSSRDGAAAVALRDWLIAQGWNDLFLDLDPERGIAAGERWERALHDAARRCEVVLFLLSRSWLGSRWCLKELQLAHRLNKRLFGVLIEDIPTRELPNDLAGAWQLVRLAAGRDHQVFRVTLPVSGDEAHVTFSAEGLARLRVGLSKAGLHANYFDWPPQNDPMRSPFRGLRPLEAEDAGIFFGREGLLIETIDRLRGLIEGGPPRILALLGASGAGKSSFLRAGLLPRLSRDEQNFTALPVVRPERAVITGEAGLLAALERAAQQANLRISRAELRVAIEAAGSDLRAILKKLTATVRHSVTDDESIRKSPAIVLAIDQAEELFVAEGAEEAQKFLSLLCELVVADDPAVIAVFTIRSDHYERLQSASALDGLHQDTLSLPPMPRGAYVEIIKGPLRRLEGTTRPVKLDEALVDELLTDLDAGGAKDALPLLAFTLGRLYDDFGATGHLSVANYRALGRIKGSIEVAVEHALKSAKGDPRLSSISDSALLETLHRAFIPWLANIDMEAGLPRRRVARASELPSEALPLIDKLVEQRLLATDINHATGEMTIEPAHEALLRQWDLLQGWLVQDAGLLTIRDGVKRAAREWAEHDRAAAWLTHSGVRLEATDVLVSRPDLVAGMADQDRDYLNACRNAQDAASALQRAAQRTRRTLQSALVVLLIGVIIGLLGWINQAFLKKQWDWIAYMRPYMNEHVRPYVLSRKAEQELKAGAAFRECDRNCPEMVVLPNGSYLMGSPDDAPDSDERPQRRVTFAKPFAVSRNLVTFDDWDACVAVGACMSVADSGFGRGTRPVINVTWDEAITYVAWLSTMTGKRYRLPTEAEWEYAARAGTQSRHFWGDDLGVGNANCKGCGSSWDEKSTAPVGSFKPNAFGLYDMEGNVWQWTEDCYVDTYAKAPTDGSAVSCDEGRRSVRGGAWDSISANVRIANRDRISLTNRINDLGFRVARDLDFKE